jgi:hypothetical protein
VVTLTGSGFTGTTAVEFNGVSDPGFSVISDTQIQASVLPGATTGPISVTNAAGTGTSTTDFVVTSAPTITTFTPSEGPVGTLVTLTGTNFSGAFEVAFNGVSDPGFSLISDTQIQASVPPGATTGPISVTNADGTGTSADDFTVIIAPTVTAFTPSEGPVGTLVTLTGSGFSGVTGVEFNSVPASGFSVVSDTQITADVPFGATTGPISVTNAAGTRVSTTDFTLTVTSWTSVDIGTSTPGTTVENGSSVTVQGSGSDICIWGGADGFRYVYDTATGDLELVAQITAWDGSVNGWSKGGLMIRNSTAPNAAHATVMGTGGRGIRMQWRAADGGGSSDSAGPASFTLPVWLKLSKAGNTISAFYSSDGTNWSQVGTAQTINLASNFLYGMAVTAHQEGAFAQATFDPISTSGIPALPEVTSFTPTDGPVGTTVTITGANFSGASEVAFNGVTDPGFSVISDTQITANVPLGATTGPISVTNADGTGVSVDDFVLQTVPDITSFAPTSGIVGTEVTLTGSGFTGVTAVHRGQVQRYGRPRLQRRLRHPDHGQRALRRHHRSDQCDQSRRHRGQCG